ncbi:MAG: permease [Coprothermobacterota bacterium]|nr:permease [Coprothermobacterota bacterium]
MESKSGCSETVDETSSLERTEQPAATCLCSVAPPNVSKRKDWSVLQAILVGTISLAGWGILYAFLESFAQWFTYHLLGLVPGTPLASAVEFFLYDTPKVLMLLALIVFAVGVVRTFFTPERTRAFLAGKREFVGNILASALGIVTPFCSCSAVPLFIGFVTAGVPLGVTFSFLVAAPMINEVAVILLFGLFGWQVAVLYVVTGLIIAIAAGWVIGRLKLERYVEDWVYKAHLGIQAEEKPTWQERVRFGLNSVREIVGKVWPYVLLGIAVGAAIHGWVPESFMASIMGKGAWWSVPLAVLVGVPLYSNAAGFIPVMQALLEKGAALGTTLAFMMATIGLSLPETIILRKVLKPRLIGVFLGVVALGIMMVGYLFNLVM